MNKLTSFTRNHLNKNFRQFLNKIFSLGGGKPEPSDRNDGGDPQLADRDGRRQRWWRLGRGKLDHEDDKAGHAAGQDSTSHGSKLEMAKNTENV